MPDDLQFLTSISLLQKLNSIRQILSDFESLESTEAKIVGMEVTAASYINIISDIKEHFKQISSSSGFFVRLGLKAGIYNCANTIQNMQIYKIKFQEFAKNFSNKKTINNEKLIQESEVFIADFISYCENTDEYYRNAVGNSARR